jgi:short-subunit dehydrogenase
MNELKQTEYIAIVTNSTRDIGKEIALFLIKNGKNVIISSRSQNSGDNTIQDIYHKSSFKKESIFTLKV